MMRDPFQDSLANEEPKHHYCQARQTNRKFDSNNHCLGYMTLTLTQLSQFVKNSTLPQARRMQTSTRPGTKVECSQGGKGTVLAVMGGNYRGAKSSGIHTCWSH